MSNKPLLIALLALLALMKFIIVPIFEWQDDILNQSQDLQFKLDKSKSYINNLDKLENQKVKLQEDLTVKLESVERFQVLPRYQIAKQKQLEQLFAEKKMTIKSLVWRDPVELEKGMQLSVVIQFSGKLKDYISMQMALAGYSSSIEIGIIGLSIRNQTQQSLGSATGNMVILFNVIEEENVDE